MPQQHHSHAHTWPCTPLICTLTLPWQTWFPRLTSDMPCHYRLAWQSMHCVWRQLLSWPWTHRLSPQLDPQTCLIAVLIHRTGPLPDLGCHHWASQLASPRRCRAAPLLVRIPASTSLVAVPPLPLLLPSTARGLAQQPHSFPPELSPQLISYNLQGLRGSHHNSNVAQESSFHPLLFSQAFTFSPYNEKGGRMQLLQTRLSNPVFT